MEASVDGHAHVELGVEIVLIAARTVWRDDVQMELYDRQT